MPSGRVPGPPVKAALVRHGVKTVSQAKQWAAMNGIAPETIAQVMRGNRPRLSFETVDRIVAALESPELWYTDLREWYHEGEEPPPEFAVACELFEDPELGKRVLAGTIEAGEDDVDYEELMQQ